MVLKIRLTSGFLVARMSATYVSLGHEIFSWCLQTLIPKKIALLVINERDARDTSQYVTLLDIRRLLLCIHT